MLLFDDTLTDGLLLLIFSQPFLQLKHSHMSVHNFPILLHPHCLLAQLNSRQLHLGYFIGVSAPVFCDKIYVYYLPPFKKFDVFGTLLEEFHHLLWTFFSQECLIKLQSTASITTIRRATFLFVFKTLA